MILDFPEELTELRQLASAESLDNVLTGNASERFIQVLDDLVRKVKAARGTILGSILPPRVAERIPSSGDTWGRLREYARRHFDSDWDLFYCPFLLEALICAFQPDCGVWMGPDAVKRREPDLEFDDDGLLIGPRSALEFTKDGVLTRQHVLTLSVPGAVKSDGFVDRLLVTAARYNDEGQLGLRIRDDLLLDKAFFMPAVSRAYIRGPRGLSLEKLQDPNFPPDPRGTVTEHQYEDKGVVAYQLFPVDGLEVEWSGGPALKQVEVEELGNPESDRFRYRGRIQNRYMHSQWDTTKQRMVHFDGAIRSYDDDLYAKRLRQDLRKFDGKQAGYRKQFKLHVGLDLHEWADLAVRYFEENDLMLEYLGGAVDTEM